MFEFKKRNAKGLPVPLDFPTELQELFNKHHISHMKAIDNEFYVGYKDGTFALSGAEINLG